MRLLDDGSSSQSAKWGALEVLDREAASAAAATTLRAERTLRIDERIEIFPPETNPLNQPSPSSAVVMNCDVCANPR